MATLIVDTQNFHKKLLSNYSHVILIVYGNEELDTVENVHDNRISVFLPTNNFDKAYKAINKKIADYCSQQRNLISLFKFNKLHSFNVGLILCAINGLNEESADVLTRYNTYLPVFHEARSVRFLSGSRNFMATADIVSTIKCFVVILYGVLCVIKGILSRKQRRDYVFVDYTGFKIIKGFSNSFDNSVSLPLNFRPMLLTLPGFFHFLSNYRQAVRFSRKIGFLTLNMPAYLYNTLKYLSLFDYYNPKIIHGVFDTNPVADQLSNLCSRRNIKLGCSSHAYNYDCRIDYIQIPFDYYFVHSKSHLKTITKNIILPTQCKLIIAGYPFHNKKIIEDGYSANVEEKYDVLVIGEYYHSSFAQHPFNSISTKNLAKALKKVSGNLSIKVRPRFVDDGYYSDIYSVLKDDVAYSVAEKDKPTDVPVTIMEDILSSRLVVSMFSMGIHDALFLNKPVLQANFVGVDTGKEMLKNNLVYYADSEDSFIQVINDFFNGKLEDLDFDLHRNDYLNNGKYDVQLVIETIKSALLEV